MGTAMFPSRARHRSLGPIEPECEQIQAVGCAGVFLVAQDGIRATAAGVGLPVHVGAAFVLEGPRGYGILAESIGRRWVQAGPTLRLSGTMYTGAPWHLASGILVNLCCGPSHCRLQEKERDHDHCQFEHGDDPLIDGKAAHCLYDDARGHKPTGAPKNVPASAATGGWRRAPLGEARQSSTVMGVRVRSKRLERTSGRASWPSACGWGWRCKQGGNDMECSAREAADSGCGSSMMNAPCGPLTP